MPQITHEISYFINFDGRGSLKLVIMRDSSQAMSKADTDFIKSLEEAISSYMGNKNIAKGEYKIENS